MSVSIGNQNSLTQYECLIANGDLVVTPYRLPLKENDQHPAMKLGDDAPLYSFMDLNHNQFATRPDDMSHVVWGANRVAPDREGRSFSGFVLVRPGVRDDWLVYNAPEVRTTFVKNMFDRNPESRFAIKDRTLERIVGLNTQKIARHDERLAGVIDDYARAAAAFVQRRFRYHGPAVDDIDEAYALALNDTRNARHSAINWIACIVSPKASIAHRAEAWRELREHENVWLDDKAMRKATRTLMVGLSDYLTRREGAGVTRQIRSLRPPRASVASKTKMPTTELQPA